MKKIDNLNFYLVALLFVKQFLVPGVIANLSLLLPNQTSVAVTFLPPIPVTGPSIQYNVSATSYSTQETVVYWYINVIYGVNQSCCF